MYLYVLELENNKWYVGITRSINHRLGSHRYGRGALWTRKYPMRTVFSVIEVDDKDAKRMERETVLSMMNTHGLNSVRGGGYTYTGDYVRPGYWTKKKT